MDMDGQIAVSIIVPLYNRKKTIGRCLDSLMRQTLKNIEIVVVDDGSTDGGAEVVKECQKSDPRIRLLVQENRGLGAARNAGIRESCGEYLG
ncbi:MAG: glycosyltransferase family 2 protein, partial [Lachnospiraceae bacterium]|nr:glycosyltransferase family 2 protein [Lachnospiraceae bacterium]